MFVVPEGREIAATISGYGFHRIGFRYHQEASLDASNNVVYSITFTLYVDGVEAASYVGLADVFSAKQHLLFTAAYDESAEGKLAYTSKGISWYQWISSSLYNSGTQGYFNNKEAYISYGDAFYIPVNEISYDLNDGEFVGTNVNFTHNSYEVYNAGVHPVVMVEHFYRTGQETVLPVPVRTGYNFTGWYTDEACTELYSADGKISAAETGALSLYAGWEACAGDIVYVLDGGTLPKGYPEVYLWSDAAYNMELPVPTKKLFTFAGWYLDTDGMETAGADGDRFSLTVPGGMRDPITVYAMWSQSGGAINYHIADGASMSGEYADSYVPNGEDIVVTLPTSVVKSGYVFAGWYDNAELTGDPITSLTVSAEDAAAFKTVDVYAKMYRVYTEAGFNGSTSGISYATKNVTVGDSTVKSATYVSQDNKLLITKIAGGDAYMYIDNTSCTSGAMIVEFKISIPEGATPLAGNLRFRSSSASHDRNIFQVSADGSLSVGNQAGLYPIGAISTEEQQISLVLHCTENAFTIDAYVDGVLMQENVPSASGLGASNMMRFNWYFGAGATGSFCLDDLYLADHVAMKYTTEITGAAISYDPMGGEMPATYPTTYTYGATLALPTPIRGTAEFVGWYLSSDFTGNALTTLPADTRGPIKLYAKYSDKNVSYVSNGGTYAEGEYTVSYFPGTGATITLPVMAERADHQFIGWYKSADFSGTAYNGSYTATDADTDELIFYAKWSYRFEANFEGEGSATTTGTGLHQIQDTNNGKLSTTVTLQNGMLVINKTARPAVYNPADANSYDAQIQQDLGALYNGKIAIEFSLAKDSAEDILGFSMHLRFKNTRQQTVVTLNDTNGEVKALGVSLGYVTETETHYAVIIDLAAGKMDAYVDGVLYAKGVNYQIPATDTISTLQQLRIYFGNETAGTVKLGEFSLYGDSDLQLSTPNGSVAIQYANTTLPMGVVSGEMILPAAPVKQGYTFIGWYADAEFSGDPITSVSANGAPITVYAKYEGNFSVTYTINGASTTLSKVCDIVLPSDMAYWIAADGSIVAGGTSVTLTADAVYVALTVDLLTGASVRLNAPSGLRFETEINEAMLELLKKNEGMTFRVGTLIVPTDKLGSCEFTAAALDAAEIAYVEMDSGLNGVLAADGVYTVYASLTNLRGFNYVRHFSAVSYIEVKIGDQLYRVYDAYAEEDNSRSVYDVATLALNSEDVYTVEETAILRSFVDSVVSLDAADLSVNNATEKYTSPFTVTYTDGVLTVAYTDGTAMEDGDVVAVLIGDQIYTDGWSYTEGKLTALYAGQ